MYAYLFYRLLHGAKTALFTWGTEGNDFGEQEMSRFLKQLIYEYPNAVNQTVLANETSSEETKPISIQRNRQVHERLDGYLDGSRKNGISPSAINTYLECKLRFYFRHIAHLREVDEVEEDLDARTLGNVLHELMELIYRDHMDEFGPIVEKHHIELLRKNLSTNLQRAFTKNFNNNGSEFIVEGKNRIAWEIILNFAKKILAMDKEYAPFEIVGLEEEFNVWVELDTERKVKMFGKVDRVDRKAGNVRIIDYKTGKDERTFKSVEGLFGKDHVKVAFQTLLYTLLYQMETKESAQITPHVFNRMAIFSGEDSRFAYGPQKSTLEVVNPLLAEFSEHLKGLLEEIFYSDEPFDQTTDTNKCKYCEFNVICQRA